MVYEIRNPVFPLNRFIKHFIYLEGSDPAYTMERFLPDGNTEIIIDLTDNTQYIYDNNSFVEVQACRRAWVSGVRTKSITIPSGKGGRSLIVAFKKGKAHPFYNFPMYQLADLVVDADLIFGAKIHTLREQLLHLNSIDQMFITLEKFLLQQAGDALYTDNSSNSIEYAVSNMIAHPNALNFQEIVVQIGYSQKHFIDLFKKYVGVSPKQYLKIMRFQKTIEEIENSQIIQWSVIAMQSGFYDQAHFINDFRDFSGFTPNEYLKRKTETLNYIPVG